MHDMLADAINATFERECGKHQIKNASNAKVFKVAFRLKTDYEKEEGYRHLEVALWGPLNYVQVWVRETWDVIPVEDLDIDEDGDSRPKKGKKYNEGATEWKKVADHDSCWRDGVRSILRENACRITGFDMIGGTFWSTHSFLELPFTGLSR